MHSILILQFLVLLALANGAPVIAKKIFGKALDFPVDGGCTFFDGRPLLGRSKTVRGVVASVLVTAVAAPVIGLPWLVGAAAACGAMAGDMLSSFIKRRLDVPPSGMAIGIDQIPESLVPALACRYWLPFSALDIGAIVLAFLACELLLSRVGYWLNLRDQPY